MNVSTALQQGAGILEKDNISAARLTAEVLLAYALRCDRVYLYAHPERELTDLEQLHYGRRLHERLGRKPTQYITGQQEFYGRMFRVTPAVLIPRPETELVVETGLRLAPGARRILDVGTGSGCLAITMQKEIPDAAVWACDISFAALLVARENAERLQAPVRLFCADLLEPCASDSADLIVSNPPYVPTEQAEGLPPEVRDHEPGVALLGGPEGLDLYARLLVEAGRVLRPGGWLVMELGFNARAGVERLIGPEWKECIVEPDLAGFDRVMAVRR